MARASRGARYPFHNESARTCGCDPHDEHVCAMHAAVVVNHEAEVCDGVVISGRVREPFTVVVTGPDDDGEIGILMADVAYLSRFAAEALAREILRRLALTGTQGAS